MPAGLWLNVLVGLFATCLVASSIYVINEVLDAPSDRFHPIKHTRPVPSGSIQMLIRRKYQAGCLEILQRLHVEGDIMHLNVVSQS